MQQEPSVRPANGVFEVCVPLPPQALSPNTYRHWATVSRAKRYYRDTCKLIARAEIVKRGWNAPYQVTARVNVRFGMADRRLLPKGSYIPRDIANGIAAIKAAIDGIVDAGLLEDDSKEYLLIGEVSIDAGAPAGVYFQFVEADAPSPEMERPKMMRNQTNKEIIAAERIARLQRAREARRRFSGESRWTVRREPDGADAQGASDPERQPT